MNPRRLHYLKAMDIDVWQRRDAVVAASMNTQAEVSAAAVSAARAAALSLLSVEREPNLISEPVNNIAPDVSNASWDELAACVKNCTVCELHRTRTQTVFGVGNRQAEWLIVGEAPGADEDRQGEPFVGRAGQLLNSMLRALGFPREQVFIANVLKCRPPGNRDPKPYEAAACAGYLSRQIELLNPRVILCVGRIAAQNLLHTDTPIGKLRGQVHHLGERPMVVTYHPAYLLRSPLEKRKAWEDLRLALDVYAKAVRA
jgi:uracil-DNA glycosylase